MDRNYGLVEATQCVPNRQTLRERLMERKISAKEHMEHVEQALAFLDANPTFEAFHNLVGKAGF